MPQGPILGPLLYLLYVNDICFASDCTILSFADDTSLYLADSNLTKLFKKANEDVNKLYDCLCSNKLSFNPTKIKCIVIKTSNTLQDTNTPLTQIGANFQEKSKQILGILIDKNLSWQHHLAYINKNYHMHYLFSTRKKGLNTDILKTLYYALIQPHLQYGIIVW